MRTIKKSIMLRRITAILLLLAVMLTGCANQGSQTDVAENAQTDEAESANTEESALTEDGEESENGAAGGNSSSGNSGSTNNSSTNSGGTNSDSANNDATSEDKNSDTEIEEVFSYWNQEAPSLIALTEYVDAVTDENSEDYIPPEDRIAVFDMDGTVCGELFPTYFEYYLLAYRIFSDPTYTPDEEVLEVGKILRDCGIDHSFPDGMDMIHANAAAKAYAGMTLSEFENFVTEALVRDVDGFDGMTYGEAFYLPMIQVVDYLQDNDFSVYIVSGSDRFICRAFLEGTIDIPDENFIGMDVQLAATGQGDTDGLNYVFSAGDDIVRTDKLLIKNLKTNKVLQIAQEIGRKPVLSFGNSSGDVSMHNYTINDNKYKSAAFMLVADDEERDYGNSAKGEELKTKWEESGFNVISMKNDFLTIYGENVKKTGTFHWAEEFKEK